MERKKKGIARFASVVAECGRPEVVTLWTKPEANQEFSRARRQNRIMTVKQETVGTRKDFGLAGFHPEKNVSFLVFPKPIDPFEGKRIVGIDYGLLKRESDDTDDRRPKRRAKKKR